MNKQVILGLFNNSALLLAMCLLYDTLALGRKEGRVLASKSFSGFTLGAIGLAVMMSPWQWQQGIIFDTRSILLCISGLFFGPIPTFIAMGMTALYRLYLGGSGALMGVAVILASGGIGIIWRRRCKDLARVSFTELYGLGLTVHFVMLALMLLLPGPLVAETVKAIGIPVMIVYPLATALLGKLLVSRHQHMHSQEALHISEERFAYAMDATSDGLWDWDVASNGGYFSPGYYRMLGYEPNEIPASAALWLDLIHPDDRERAHGANLDCIENRLESFEVEFRMRDKNGGWRWVLGRGKAVARDENGKALRLVGTHVDITARKAAEERLRESEKRYREVFDNSFDAIFILEVTDGKKFKILDINAREEHLLGMQASQVKGKYIEEFLPPEMAQLVGENYRRCIEAGSSMSYEESVDFASGSTNFFTTLIPVRDDKDRICRVVGISHDVTQRKQAEEKVLESERMYRQLFEMESDAIFLIASDNCEILAANPTASILYGFEREELLSMKSVDLSAEPHQTVRATDEKHTIIPIRMHRKRDGTVFPVEITASHFSFKGRDVHLAAIRDISERIEAEQERKELIAQLSHSQKMEAVGQLAGGIAHDFNNILTVIFGYGHILLLKMDPDSPLRLPVEQILFSASRAADLIQRLLAFSRKQVLIAMPLNLGAVVTETENMLKRLVREDIDFHVWVTERVLTVNADRGQLGQVLINLVTNAVDAMPGGGTLTIKVDSFEMDDSFVKHHGYGKPGRYACISITDSGCGMDPETAAKVFDPFFTTKEVGKGTGLGLSIVYGIIKQHDGFVGLESEKDIGSKFVIYLPLAEADTPERGAERSEPAKPALGNETILLAEDDENVRWMNAKTYQDAGYRVIEAGDGEDAVAKFMKYKDTIDLLVFDVIMPRRDGKNAYEEIRKMCPDMKVLFMSGYTKDIIINKGVLEEEVFFIAKPFKPLELLNFTRNILDR